MIPMSNGISRSLRHLTCLKWAKCEMPENPHYGSRQRDKILVSNKGEAWAIEAVDAVPRNPIFYAALPRCLDGEVEVDLVLDYHKRRLRL